MGKATAGLGGTAPGASAEPPGGSDDRLISLPGRSPVLDAAQLGTLRGYASERDVAAGDVLFADGDELHPLQRAFHERLGRRTRADILQPERRGGRVRHQHRIGSVMRTSSW